MTSKLVQPPQSAPLNDDDEKSLDKVSESLRLIEDLKFFLATAPANWQENQVIRRYYLNHDEGFVSCVYWNNLYFITGTDIVRCIVYKFEHFGRKILDRKKFEEGIFSDLRNLKCGTDAILEPPRSEFLEFLFKNSCLRTQKKQKVFFWFNVPHDKLMADALERDLKKEKLGQNATTTSHREPSLSFKYDETSNLYTQLAEHMERQKRANDIPTLSAGTGDSAAVATNNNNNNTSTTNININTTQDSNNSNSNTASNSASEVANSATNNNSVSTETTASFKTQDYAATPHHPQVKQETYEFLNQDTPAQYKAQSDYEDDFPLDYFNPNDPSFIQQQNQAHAYAAQQQHFKRQQLAHQPGYNQITAQASYANNDDYITLDANYHSNGYNNLVDDSYDSIVDPSVFIYPANHQINFNGSAAASASQVVYNDEYLIEQTQPLKTPLPTKSSKLNEDFFPPPPPMSAKYQTSFPRQLHPATATITVTTPLNATHFPQQLQPQSSIQQFNYDPIGPFYPVDAQIAYNYKQRAMGGADSDYWVQQPNSAMYGSMEQMIQVPVNQHMYVSDQEYFAAQQQNSLYQGMNSTMMNVPLQNQQAQLHGPGNQNAQQSAQASTRQHQISAAMMMKKRQLFSNKGHNSNGISKPSIGDNKPTNYTGTLDEVLNSRATKLVNNEGDQVKAEPSGDGPLVSSVNGATPSITANSNLNA